MIFGLVFGLVCFWACLDCLGPVVATFSLCRNILGCLSRPSARYGAGFVCPVYFFGTGTAD